MIVVVCLKFREKIKDYNLNLFWFEILFSMLLLFFFDMDGVKLFLMILLVFYLWIFVGSNGILKELLYI